MLSSQMLQNLRLLEFVLLYVLSFAAVFSLLRLLPVRKRRITLSRLYREFVHKPPSPLMLKLLFISAKPDRWAEKLQLLEGAGIGIPVLRYTVWKRAGILAGSAVLLLGVWGWRHPAVLFHVQPIHILAAGCCMLVFIAGDNKLLESVKTFRSRRIVKEIYVVSNQLLYYTGSRLNLHGKLMNCLPYTRVIRQEFRLLLNEWYEDAGMAIARFKRRIGTDEGSSFADTLHSLRMHEHEAYYELLRQRIRDYKDKLDLIKDSQKETTSYVLFVLAGIPILNTFRLFAYPWVEEGQKLFQSLNG